MSRVEISRRAAPDGASYPRRSATSMRRRTLQDSQRRLPWAAVIGLTIGAAMGCQDAARPTSPNLARSGAVSAVGVEKTAICHAAGGAENPRFVELTVSDAARSAHMDERGKPHSGHERDYLVTARTPCPPLLPATPNVTICKAVNADHLLSRFFDFTVNGEKVSVRGSTCVDRTFRVGTPVTITEAIATGTYLYSITITPSTAGTGNVSAATASIVAGIDRAEVIFSNRVRLGGLAICKDVEPAGLFGKLFEFEVTAQGGLATVHVTGGGACALVGTYPVGTSVGIVEMVGAGSLDIGIITKGITVQPDDRLVAGSLNLTTRRVSVTIGEGRTDVRYLNARPVGSLEICTVMPAGFTGAPQFFVNAGWADGLLASLTVPANQCATVQPLGFGLPVGYAVTIGESVPGGVRLDAVTVDPPDHLIGTTSNTANVLIGAGVTRVTFRHVLNP